MEPQPIPASPKRVKRRRHGYRGYGVRSFRTVRQAPRRSVSPASEPSPDADGSIRQGNAVENQESGRPGASNSQLTTHNPPRPPHLRSGHTRSRQRNSWTRYKKRAGREATLRRVVTAGLAVRERRVRGQGLANTDRDGPLPETRKRPGRVGGSGRAIHEPGTEKS